MAPPPPQDEDELDKAKVKEAALALVRMKNEPGKDTIGQLKLPPNWQASCGDIVIGNSSTPRHGWDR